MAERDFFSGPCRVIDGDTIVVKKQMIRLFGIDAPELEHPWGQKSKWKLVELVKGKTITIVPTPEKCPHGRMVGKCYLWDGTDLSAEMVRQGMAIDWPKFSNGAYSHLEVEGVRKRFWRADARQKGNMAAFNAPTRAAPKQ